MQKQNCILLFILKYKMHLSQNSKMFALNKLKNVFSHYKFHQVLKNVLFFYQTWLTFNTFQFGEFGNPTRFQWYQPKLISFSFPLILVILFSHFVCQKCKQLTSKHMNASWITILLLWNYIRKNVYPLLKRLFWFLKFTIHGNGFLWKSSMKH